MKTQTLFHRLEGGQALALQAGTARAVLAHGEVLAQQPARWLGGVVVPPSAERFVAPALLPLDAGLTFVAARESSVVVQGSVPWSLREALVAVAARVRALVPRPTAL